MGLRLPVKPLCNAFLIDAVAWERGVMIGDGEGGEAWGGGHEEGTVWLGGEGKESGLAGRLRHSEWMKEDKRLV